VKADLDSGNNIKTGTNPKKPRKKDKLDEKIFIESIKIFRQPVYQVPVDQWAESVEKFLLPHTLPKGGSNRALLTEDDVRALVASSKRWHQIAGREKHNPIDIADLVVLLTFMTRQVVADREARNSFSISDEQQKEIDRRTGKGVEASLIQPFGS
jgi:hypothetical protein